MSKHYLAGEVEQESLYLKPRSLYDNAGYQLRLGVRVEQIDRDSKTVKLSDHSMIRYDHLVLATGSQVRRLTSPGAELKGIYYLHDIADADALREALVPVVIDGDGLFGLAWNEAGEPLMLREREVPTLLTPHDGEYSLLTGSPAGVDRILAARRLAADTGAVVLLKGPVTVVAEPDGRARLVTDGDQRLATAGSGDVLAGIVAALVSTGLGLATAAAAGAWIHAAAGRLGSRSGTVAGDLVEALPVVLDELLSDDADVSGR